MFSNLQKIFLNGPVFFGLFSVPAAVPSVQEKVEGNKVKVSWMEIPRGQRGGCIISYTIYLESSSGDHQACKKHLSEV